MLANLQHRAVASLSLLLLAVSGPVVFVQSNPDTTCTPSAAGLFINSGDCETKPGAAAARHRAYRESDRSQQLRCLGVDHWHDAGFRGHGIKVAVLDSGFRGYHQYLG